MKKKTVFIGSDHAGFFAKEQLVEFLAKKGFNISDIGPFSHKKTDDYPDIAKQVCQLVQKKKGVGILLCATGVGMSVSANKCQGIIAGVGVTPAIAKRMKEHNHTNVLTLGAEYMSAIQMKKIANAWLTTPFDMSVRHKRRVKKVKLLEKAIK
ncbi:MAG: RpiB/LacA/LacB family sugar-phosphate isomerase [Candidatus Woesearchaeota archaeon]